MSNRNEQKLTLTQTTNTLNAEHQSIINEIQRGSMLPTELLLLGPKHRKWLHHILNYGPFMFPDDDTSLIQVGEREERLAWAILLHHMSTREQKVLGRGEAESGVRSSGLTTYGRSYLMFEVPLL